MRLFLALCLLLAAGGCAGNGARPGAAVALPPLRLAPSSLPAPLALQQALQFIATIFCLVRIEVFAKSLPRLTDIELIALQKRSP